MDIFSEPIEFIWDEGNIIKSFIKHSVSNAEAEECYFDKSKVIFNDIFHSKIEERYILLGKTKHKRLLYIVFTTRNSKIRIISARDINKKEVYMYEKKA